MWSPFALEYSKKCVRRSRPGYRDFRSNKLILNATHTHNGPVTEEGKYTLPERGVMKPAQYAEFMTGELADAIVAGWQKRRKGRIAWGQSQAVVAHNRRACVRRRHRQDVRRHRHGGLPRYGSREDHDLTCCFSGTRKLPIASSPPSSTSPAPHRTPREVSPSTPTSGIPFANPFANSLVRISAYTCLDRRLRRSDLTTAIRETRR